jgi:DNA-binding CsgD family transcriptional regulator
MVMGTLRPIERRMTRLAASGVPVAETGRRFHHSGDFVERVLELASLPGRDAAAAESGQGLRPLERRLLRWREQGADPQELADRFRRSPEHIERVLALADYKTQRAR